MKPSLSLEAFVDGDVGLVHQDHWRNVLLPLLGSEKYQVAIHSKRCEALVEECVASILDLQEVDRNEVPKLVYQELATIEEIATLAGLCLLSAELRSIADRDVIVKLAERYGIDKLLIAASFPDGSYQVPGEETEDRIGLAAKLCFGSWLAIGLSPAISERFLLRFPIDHELLHENETEPSEVCCEIFQRAIQEWEGDVQDG